MMKNSEILLVTLLPLRCHDFICGLVGVTLHRKEMSILVSPSKRSIVRRVSISGLSKSARLTWQYQICSIIVPSGFSLVVISMSSCTAEPQMKWIFSQRKLPPCNEKKNVATSIHLTIERGLLTKSVTGVIFLDACNSHDRVRPADKITGQKQLPSQLFNELLFTSMQLVEFQTFTISYCVLSSNEINSKQGNFRKKKEQLFYRANAEVAVQWPNWNM